MQAGGGATVRGRSHSWGGAINGKSHSVGVVMKGQSGSGAAYKSSAFGQLGRPGGGGFWVPKACLPAWASIKRERLEMCKVGMRSGASFAAGQVRDAPGMTPPDASPIQGSSSSHQLVGSFSSSTLLTAPQDLSPWPGKALSCSGLRRAGGSPST